MYIKFLEHMQEIPGVKFIPKLPIIKFKKQQFNQRLKKKNIKEHKEQDIVKTLVKLETQILSLDI